MSLETAVPLILCGRQRAGTRYLADLLNAFDEVTLQGEVPASVLSTMVQFLDDAEAAYEKVGRRDERWKRYYEYWNKSKKMMIFSIWSSITMGLSKIPSKNCKYFGYKRPSEEFYFEFYEKHLGSNKVLYIFCIRNFKDNYLSVVSRWPNRKIENVSDDYIRSINQYLKIKSSNPEQVLLFNLDDRIRIGFEYVERNILHPLGLLPDEALRRKLAGMGARNQTEEIARMPRRRELTAREARYIRQRPELETSFNALCERP